MSRFGRAPYAATRERKAGEAEELRRGIENLMAEAGTALDLIREDDDQQVVLQSDLQDLLDKVDARASLKILEELDDVRRELAEREEVIRAFIRSAYERDNGYVRCRFCRAQTHQGQQLTHRKTCPVRKATKK